MMPQRDRVGIIVEREGWKKEEKADEERLEGIYSSILNRNKMGL